MITLYQFAPVWGLPSGSPFCVKLHAYLRMAGLEYRAETASPVRAPKGKLPYIDDDGRVIADSGLIVDDLQARHGDPVDARLTPDQRAFGHAIRRMAEEHLYWSLMYGRWIDPAGWAVHGPAYFADLPAAVRPAVAGFVRRLVRKELHGQGMGRHGAAEAYALGCADLEALSGLLGDKPYLTGAEPASVDAAVYGLLAHILFVPVENPLKERASALANLTAYADRMRARYFPEEAG